jgi:hypothetical protein
MAAARSKLDRDLKTLALFIGVFCRHQHRDAERSPVQIGPHDVSAITGRPVVLCRACAKLLSHAFVKRSHCPMDPKPACKRCPSHCYHPSYRTQIRQVMKYSGRRLLLTGRLHYLFHLLS